jgi:hypothetical protein
LKNNGFTNFARLEGKTKGYPDKRGSRIYLPVCLLTLSKRLSKDDFKAFEADYLKKLKNLKEVEKKRFRARKNEKSYHYMIEFERARKTVVLFSEGKE